MKEIRKRLTEKEFFKLIHIQQKYLKLIIKSEEFRFNLSLSKLDDKSKTIIKLCKDEIINKINKKIQSFIDNNAWELGLVHINVLYWKAHFLVILPLLYKHYNHLTLTALKNQYDGDLISEFLLTNYPYLKKSLINTYQYYCDMRKEYKESKLSIKLGYGDILPDPTYNPKGFALSTVQDLIREIKNFNSKKELNNLTVNKLHKEGKKQQDISKITGIPQPTISRIIRKNRKV